MRIFIHNVDTFLGRILVSELRKAEDGYNRVFGTVAKSRERAPAKVKRILSRGDPKSAKKMIETIQSCALVIVDLFNSTAEDLHFLMQALKVDMKQTPPKPSGELEQEVTVILISSVMVWSHTPSEGVLRDSDWQRRKPAPASKYEQWRDMENLVLTTFNQEESQIKGFVVAGGALYGEGEDTFGRLFKDAWCGIQDHVITASGENRIPMVHVRDLSRLVRQLAFYSPDVSPMETPYFLAVDQPPAPPEKPPPPSPSPEPAVQAAAAEDEAEAAQEGEAAGDEEQEAKEEEEEQEEEPAAAEPAEAEAEEAEDGGEEAQQGDEEKPKSKPSTQAEIVQGIVDEMADHYDVPVVEPSQVAAPEPDPDFPSAQDTLALDLVVEPSKVMLDEEFAAASDPPGWWCREGMLANARKIAAEFCVQRELRAVRVVVAGPPASGKSTLCKAISEHFRIPCLLLDPKDLDATTAQLSGNVCRYRGFVLDAGLAGYDEVEKLFCYDAEVERGEDEEEEEEAEPPEDPEDGEEGGAERPKVKIERRINMGLCPEFVIVTQAPEPLCRARFKQQRGGGAIEAFELQHQHYAGLNLSERSTFADFFHDVAKFGVFNLPVAGKDEEDMFESARIYIEKAGRPFNYLPSEAEVTAEIVARLAKKEQRGASPGSKAARVSGQEDEPDDEFFTEDDRESLIAAHLQEHARLKEVPLREYLMRCMIPTLTDGLIEMCKVLPDNPADYLATYVENHAADPPADHLRFDFSS